MKIYQLKKRILWMNLLYLGIFGDGFAQTISPKELTVYQSAPKLVKNLLDSLIEHDPMIEQFRSRFQKQKALVTSKDVLPNPELGIDWTPISMQKALNQTLAIRAMQTFPWPGTISSSVALQEQQSEIEYWNFLQRSNERMTQFVSLLLDYERINKQKDLLNFQLKWMNTLKSDLKTKLSIENVRKSMLELEIEESLLLQKQLELAQEKQNVGSELASIYPSKNYPDSIGFLMSTNQKTKNWTHPALESALIKQKIGIEKHKLATNEGKPMISLGAEYMWLQESMPITTPAMQMQPAFMFMASISLPIYRKKYDGLKREALQSQNEGEFEFEAVRNNLQSKVEVLQNQRELKKNEYELYNSIILQKLKEMSVLEKEDWESGKGSLSSWIDIERRILEQKALAINAIIALKKIELELQSITAWEEKP